MYEGVTSRRQCSALSLQHKLRLRIETIAATIASYFSLYVQEEIGITAAQLSVILLICTLWDAINDPMMGVICDTLHPRWGRYRTWFTFFTEVA